MGPRIPFPARLRIRLGLDREWWLLAAAIGVGIVMGAAAIGFILPIRWLEGALERLSHEGGSRVWLVLLVPVAGAMLTGLVFLLIPSAFRGHGVSRVLYAVNRQQSLIPLRIGVRHWFASTCTIGSGGSAGPEGPIVTIGATLGSNAARWLRGDPASTASLLGCGCAAGLAAVFNAPMAGIFFTLEVILRDFSLRTFTPIVVASVVSAATAQTLLGTQEPLFGVGPDFFRDASEFFSLRQTPFFIALGVCCGFGAVGFTKLLPIAERAFHRLPVTRNLRPTIGALLLVAVGAGYLWVRGANGLPPFYGAGYGEARTLMTHDTYTLALTESGWSMFGFALVLLASGLLKALATCLTLGSGGAGGLFAPSLLLGAFTGGAFGMALQALGPSWAPQPAHCALMGMAAMIAGSTHAPLTGVLLVYELTHSYSVVLPLMLTAVVSTMVARLLFKESIYTAELAALGIRIGSMSDLTVLRRLRVSDLELARPVLVQLLDPAQRLVELSERHGAGEFVVQDSDGHYRGMVTARDLRETLVHRDAIPLLTVEELTRDDLPRVLAGDTLDVALDRFSRHDVESLPVVLDAQTREVHGLISRQALLRRYQQELEREA
ncbi:MAG: chloride channel protein [Planctomycetes bacterium]|nr:chloride channel protein [Planctomycetota bacterium]